MRYVKYFYVLYMYVYTQSSTPCVYNKYVNIPQYMCCILRAMVKRVTYHIGLHNVKRNVRIRIIIPPFTDSYFT